MRNSEVQARPARLAFRAEAAGSLGPLCAPMRTLGGDLLNAKSGHLFGTTDDQASRESSGSTINVIVCDNNVPEALYW